MCVSTCVCVCVSFLLPSCGSQGQNSGCQAWWQALWLAISLALKLKSVVAWLWDVLHRLTQWSRPQSLLLLCFLSWDTLLCSHLHFANAQLHHALRINGGSWTENSGSLNPNTPFLLRLLLWALWSKRQKKLTQDFIHIPLAFFFPDVTYYF